MGEAVSLGRDAYRTLVRQHAGDLYRFAHRLSGNASLADDLVQETFSEAWRGRASLEQPERARGWLFSILRHRWAHHVRDAGRRPRVVTEVPDTAAELGDSAATQASQRDLLLRVLNDLDDRFKIPLLMVFVQGYTCQETADELGLPLGTVVSRIHRARTQVRKALGRLDLSASGVFARGGQLA